MVLWAAHLFFAFVFGLCLGSFATALAWRLPRGISIVSEKKSKDINKKQAAVSRCTHCKSELTLADLIPLFSWLFNLGKCRHCKKPVSPCYPLIELATAGLCVTAYLVFGATAQALVVMAAAPVLVSLIAIDLEHYIIPDELNVALAALAAAGIGLDAWAQPEFSRIKDMVLAALTGGAVAFVMFFLLRFTFMKIMKREAMGFGDVKLFGVMGLWLQVSSFPAFLIISGASGVLLSLLWKPLTGSAEFPFGPSLVLAFIICLFTGQGLFLD